MAPQAASPVSLPGQSGSDEKTVLSRPLGLGEGESPPSADTMRLDLRIRRDVGSTVGLRPRPHPHPRLWSTTMEPRIDARSLSKPAKIGVPIGVVFGFILLVFCLYPFIIRLVHKRRNRHALNSPDDGEGGVPIAGLGDATTGTASTTTPMAEVQAARKERRMSTDRHAREVRTFETGKDVGMPDYHDPHSDAAIPSAAAVPGAEHVPSSPSHPHGVDTEMTGLEGQLGHSASYYDKDVPLEAFNVDTSHDEWDAAGKRQRQSSGWSGPTRTSTRMSASSLLDSLVRLARSDRGSSSSKTTVISPKTVISTSPTTMSPPGRPIASPEISESPTDFSAQPNALSRSMGEPSPSPPVDAARASGIQFTSLPSSRILLSAEPPPGTVDPRAIMPAATSSEQKWFVENELADMASSAAGSPPNAGALQTDFPPPRAHQAAPVRAWEDPDLSSVEYNGPHGPHGPQDMDSQTLTAATYEEQQYEQGQQQQNTIADAQFALEQDAFPPVSPIPEVYVKMEPGSHTDTLINNYGQSIGHHRHNSSVELYPTDTDASTPFNHHASPSGPSSLSTPNTQLDSPSPAVFSSPELGTPEVKPEAESPPQAPTMALVCDQCNRRFDMPHRLNHHKRYHQRPHVCDREGCGKRFGTRTHLDRHINDIHEQTKKFYCIEPGCVYSRHGGKSFPRKDNLRRHMMNIHNNATDIVDETMTG